MTTAIRTTTRTAPWPVISLTTRPASTGVTTPISASATITDQEDQRARRGRAGEAQDPPPGAGRHLRAPSRRGRAGPSSASPCVSAFIDIGMTSAVRATPATVTSVFPHRRHSDTGRVARSSPRSVVEAGERAQPAVLGLALGGLLLGLRTGAGAGAAAPWSRPPRRGRRRAAPRRSARRRRRARAAGTTARRQADRSASSAPMRRPVRQMSAARE